VTSITKVDCFMDISEFDNEWFDVIQNGKGHARLVSKFLRKEFATPAKMLDRKWASWTPDEKLRFAGAFPAKVELSDSDQNILDFWMDNGDERVWRTIALLVVRHRDRKRALKFLRTRVAEGTKPLANYYQALELLKAWECISIMQRALTKHHREIDSQPSIDRMIYLDYLACSAALYTITGQEEYRANLEKMLKHPDDGIRRTTRMVAGASRIAIE